MEKDTKAMLVKMANKNTMWLFAPTRHNANKIRDFLRKKSKGKKIIPGFTYSAIERETGINRKQVAKACEFMAFKQKPFVKIFADKITFGKKFRLQQKVMLI